MKRKNLLLVALIFLLGMIAGCGSKNTHEVAVNKNIVVLVLDGNLSGQSGELEKAWKAVLEWMDKDLIKTMKQYGFQAVLIKDMQEYQPEMGNLLVVNVEHFSVGNRVAKAFLRFGSGTASLDLSYKLVDDQGKIISEWRDGVGSSKGGIHCAQTLNRKALEKVASLIGS